MTTEHHRIKLLFIEDDEVDRMAFARFAEAEELPYDYAFSPSVEDARAKLATEKYDIVLCDYELADGTAFELYPQIQDAPFIVVTGSGDEERAVKAIKAGAYDYVIKDHDRNYLKTMPVTIVNALRRHEMEKALRDKDAYINAVIQNVFSGLVTLHESGTITTINPHAARAFGYAPDEVLGKSIEELMPQSFVINQEKTAGLLREGRLRIVDMGYEGEGARKDGSTFPMALNVSEMWLGDRRHYIISFMDITERRRMEEERERLIKELQEALAKIKVMSGLIPICAVCKKIRDDGGYWEQLESYITQHSNAQFSHGLCPPCFEKAMKDVKGMKNRIQKTEWERREVK